MVKLNNDDSRKVAGNTTNMFREFSMRNVAGYNELSNEQKDLFDKTYRKHLSSLPLDEQACFTENELQKIELIDSKIKVHFRHGDCYYYLPGNIWIKINH